MPDLTERTILASSADPVARTEIDSAGTATVRLAGELDRKTLPRLRRALEEQLREREVRKVEVDASCVTHGDTAGMALLYELIGGAFTPGAVVSIGGLSPELQVVLDAFPPRDAAVGAPPPRRRRSLTEQIGGALLDIARDLNDQVAFLGGVTQELARSIGNPKRMRWAEVNQVIERAGVDALPIVSLISMLTGLIIAFESSQPLARFGAQLFIADMIGLVMIRELSPIMTAIVLAGRSGSAFAAEIGTMKVNEELNALETMGLSPMRFLVIQRVLAGVILTPLLTVFSMAAGVLGGILVMFLLGFPLGTIWTELASSVGASDILFGVAKSIVFGAMVAGLGCLRGLQTKTGPSAVGQSTTRAVVAGILMIMAVDAVFAVIGYVLKI